MVSREREGKGRDGKGRDGMGRDGKGWEGKSKLVYQRTRRGRGLGIYGLYGPIGFYKD